MSTKKTEAVAVIDEESYPILREGTAELLGNMLGDLTMKEILTMKVPAGGGISWEIPTFIGEPDSAKTVDVVIVSMMLKQRTLWDGAYGEGDTKPPLCKSGDSQNGIGAPGGECIGCPKSQWAEEKGGPPPECSEHGTIWCFLPGHALPMAVRVPQQSLLGARQYYVGLFNQFQAPHQVVTRLGLKKKPMKNGSGDFAVMTFDTVRDLEVPAAAQLKEAVETFALRN